MHLEILVEEPSAEAFLDGFLPRIIPAGTSVKLIPFQGKKDLLGNLEKRLKAYRQWIPRDWRIVVLVDEDRQDCRKLKRRLEAAAEAAGIKTKSTATSEQWIVLNRIAIEELEAWFFGDVEGLRAAYPGVPASLGNRAGMRDPDAVPGGTWEQLEKVLQRAGHHRGGLAKIELARKMAGHLDPDRNRSRSFRCFVDGLASLWNRVG